MQQPRLSPGEIAKKVVTNPGVGGGIVGSLFFVNITNWAVGTRAAAGVVSLVSTILSLTKPRFLEKIPRLAKHLLDRRTSLRAGGVAGVVIALTTFGLKGLCLPVFAGLLAGVGGFAAAEEISRVERGETLAPPAKGKKLSLLAFALKNPALYYSGALACVGLMAGGAALYVLPVVALAFGVSLRNSLQGRPPCTGHPMALTAIASVAFSRIAFKNDLPVLGIAHALDALLRVNIESRMTPGGLPRAAKQVSGETITDIRDMRAGVREVWAAAIDGLRSKTAPPSAPATVSPPRL